MDGAKGRSTASDFFDFTDIIRFNLSFYAPGCSRDSRPALQTRDASRKSSRVYSPCGSASFRPRIISLNSPQYQYITSYTEYKRDSRLGGGRTAGGIVPARANQRAGSNRRHPRQEFSKVLRGQVGLSDRTSYQLLVISDNGEHGRRGSF